MTTEITNLLAESQMSAVMVGEQIESSDCTAEANAAYNAIQKAEKSSTPLNNKIADDASVAWINANEDKARRIIQRRINVRAAATARRGYY